MVNIFRSCGYSLVGLGAVGWIGIVLTGIMFAGPTDSNITDFFAEVMIVDLSVMNVPFSIIAEDLFNLVAQLNLVLSHLWIFDKHQQLVLKEHI